MKHRVDVHHNPFISLTIPLCSRIARSKCGRGFIAFECIARWPPLCRPSAFNATRKEIFVEGSNANPKPLIAGVFRADRVCPIDFA